MLYVNVQISNHWLYVVYVGNSYNFLLFWSLFVIIFDNFFFLQFSPEMSAFHPHSLCRLLLCLSQIFVVLCPPYLWPMVWIFVPGYIWNMNDAWFTYTAPVRGKTIRIGIMVQVFISSSSNKRTGWIKSPYYILSVLPQLRKYAWTSNSPSMFLAVCFLWCRIDAI